MADVKVSKVASTLHALDESFWFEERDRDLEKYDWVLNYVPVAGPGEGRLTTKDGKMGDDINDVWGFFMANLILSREDTEAQQQKFLDLLGLVSTSDNAQDQAIQWNKWTQELKSELTKRGIPNVLPISPFLNKSLTGATKEPFDIGGEESDEEEPAGSGSDEDESDEDESDEKSKADKRLNQLLDFYRKFSHAAYLFETYLDTPDGESRLEDDDVKKLVAAFARADNRPLPKAGETKQDRLIVILLHLGKALRGIAIPLDEFAEAHLSNSVVETMVADVAETLDFY